jgi:2-phosphoglycerate kinase
VTSGPICLISGVPRAGKTTVAHALAVRVARAVVVTGDDIRDLVVSGFASARTRPSIQRTLSR